MGYTASLIASSGTIDIPVERAGDLLAAFRAHETVHGHISWCGMTTEYTGTPAEVVAQMLEDFGFDTATDDRHITLEGWQGDKIGSAWDKVWQMLAPFAVHEVTWYLCGEDQTLWAEVIEGGASRQAEVVLSVA